MTEKRDDMICEICGHPMTYEEQIKVFTCGPFDYHAKALMYQCSCCGYEKLGTCMVQFWENDTPPENFCETLEIPQSVSNVENQKEIVFTEEIITTDAEDSSIPRICEDVSQKKCGIRHQIQVFLNHWLKDHSERTDIPDCHETIKSEEESPIRESNVQSESANDSKKETEEDTRPKPLEKEPTKDTELQKQEKKADKGNETSEPESAQQPYQDEKQESIRPDMYETINGKHRISDTWMDYMLEHSIWYPWWYNHFVSNERKTDRYLKSHTPACQIIRNDVLYDTQTAKMYLAVEKTSGKGKRKIYNYVTPAKKYFSITVMMGRPDDLMIMEEKDVKKLLAEYPDIYREVIDSVIIE